MQKYVTLGKIIHDMSDSKENRFRELRRDQLFEEEFNDILESLGITCSEEFNLILHNDNINDMLHVVLAVADVCRLSYEESMRKMRQAHEKGRSILKNGNIDDLHYMRLGLERRGLTATLERAE
jgi:ATP-dependent Clp protease adapter protein ClpS